MIDHPEEARTDDLMDDDIFDDEIFDDEVPEKRPFKWPELTPEEVDARVFYDEHHDTLSEAARSIFRSATRFAYDAISNNVSPPVDGRENPEEYDEAME